MFEVKIIKRKIEVECLVSSEAKNGSFYLVESKDDEWTCTCPDFSFRENNCKHINEAKRTI